MIISISDALGPKERKGVGDKGTKVFQGISFMFPFEAVPVFARLTLAQSYRCFKSRSSIAGFPSVLSPQDA